MFVVAINQNMDIIGLSDKRLIGKREYLESTSNGKNKSIWAIKFFSNSREDYDDVMWVFNTKKERDLEYISLMDQIKQNNKNGTICTHPEIIEECISAGDTHSCRVCGKDSFIENGNVCRHCGH